jgi:hypothetical protein
VSAEFRKGWVACAVGESPPPTGSGRFAQPSRSDLVQGSSEAGQLGDARTEAEAEVRKRLCEPRERPHGHVPEATSTPAHHAMPSRLASGGMRSRWTAAGMLEVERQPRKIIGDQHLAWLAVAVKQELGGKVGGPAALAQ